MNPRWLLRMSQWARNPPSERKVLLGLAVFAMCLILLGVERFIGWPAWMVPNGTPRGRMGL